MLDRADEDEGIERNVKHRKPNRIKASTSLPLAAAAAVVTLLSAPANAAPGGPSVAPSAPQQPGAAEQPAATEESQAPETKTEVIPGNGAQGGTQGGGTQGNGAQPGTQGNGAQGGTQGGGTQGNGAQGNGTQVQPSQPGVTNPNTGAGQGAQQPKTDTQPAGNDPKSKTQPGVSTPRVAPLPVPGQQGAQVVPVQVQPGTNGEQGQASQAGTQTQPGTQGQGGAQANQGGQQANQGAQAEEKPTETLTGEQPAVEKPRWTAPAVEAAPAAPVVEMSGPHTEVGANIDGGAILAGFAANTHHFSNLDGYVGTIGYTTPGGIGEAGVALDYTVRNQIKVTAYSGNGAGADQKIEFLLDTTVANAVKADAENWIRLMPGGATILEAAAQVGKLPAGELASNSIDVGGVTGQVGGTVQY